ncbi:hypothetical protein GH714_004367 [Hevea brasiliensis]|uniref:Uncharacterized protein n=1 Tax=Hevea brasiliensis TaxID=3981 RepID=A0A6A6LE00_HEVBR|nr:hypothetical protein GH714_004367 [Hevea brasiliensis]
MLHAHLASRESSLDRDNVKFRENKGLGIDLNMEFGLQTIGSCPPREIAGDWSLNREAVEFRENKGLGIDLNVEFCLEAEVSEVLRATRAVDKVLGNGLELEVGRFLEVEKSSSTGDSDAKEVGDLLKKKKEFGAPPFQEGEEKHKFSGLILLSEAAEMQELKPPTNAKESEALVAAEGKRSIESSSSKRSSESSGEDCLHEDLEHTSPMVRTKRGRSQVLPSRYRYSVVLTPLKWVVRSQGTAAAPMVPKK